VFLKKTNRQGWMLYVPMLFMLAVTFTALVITIVQLFGLFSAGTFAIEKHALQLIFAILLLALGVMVAIQGVQKLTEKKTASFTG
jgi:carbon starvation protein